MHGRRKAAATVEVGGSAALGQFLVDARGMTLYQSLRMSRTRATFRPVGVQLATAAIEAQVPSAGPGATGLLGQIQRNDFIQQ